MYPSRRHHCATLRTMDEPYVAGAVAPTDQQLALWAVNDATQKATGPCPRCGETSVEELSAVAIAMGGNAAGGRSHGFICDCDGTHLEGNVPRKGCGAFWAAVIDVQTVPQIRSAPPGQAATAAIALVSAGSPVKEIRASAEKWASAVTTLIGLFGIAAVVFGKDAATSLNAHAALALGLTAGAALLCAITGVLLIWRAAHGWPIVKSIKSDDDLVEWYKAREDPRVAVASFRRALAATVLSVVLLGAAVGIVWYSPRIDPPRTQVLIGLTDGSSVCGRLEASTIAGRIAVQKADGAISSLPFTQAIRLEVVSKCQ